MDFEAVKQLEREYLMPTYGRFPVSLVSGHGATAVDESGREYIDFGAGIGVNSLGYCDAGWVEAVSGQAARLQHVSNLYYSEVQIRFAEHLCRAAGFDKALLCNSGAEANECAVKLARKYSFDKYGPGRATIVTLENSFHGRTITTLSATGQESFHNYFFPFTEGFVFARANDLADLEAKLDETVCAVLLEAVQGEGGVVPLDPDYARRAAQLCRERDILVMFDEVQTGIGRTGALLASERLGVTPDAVTLAKGLGGGLPIGACLCAPFLGETLGPGQHGTTFGGNPVVCAGADYVLSRVADEGFLRRVREQGDHLRARIAAMPHVEEVRGMGMMLGVRLSEGLAAREIAEQCLAGGLLILTAKTLLRLLPPLTITREEIDRGLAVLETVLKHA